MIDSGDISIVVQGTIDKSETSKCLISIRKNLSKAEIILSTWNGENINGLDYDVLVLNEDPGAIIHDYRNNISNNCNRQIVSTQNGIKNASKKYCLKLRSDLILKNNNFLNYWDKFPVVNEEFKIFKHRLLVSSVYSREFAEKTKFPTPFHPSDFWLFGLTEDLKSYFLNIKLQSKIEAGNYGYKYPNRLPYNNFLWRYPPEQYFCFSYIKQNFSSIEFDDWTDWNEDNIEYSNNIIYNNFIFLGLHEGGIFSKKHSWAINNENSIYGLITYNKFQARYKTYCAPDYIIIENKYIKNKKKLHSHLTLLHKSIKKRIIIFKEILAVLYYFLKVMFSYRKKDEE